MLSVGINGFGRIGRCVMRAEREGVRIVGINDLTDAPTLAHLLRYDSVHGRYPGRVEARERAIAIDGDEIAVTAEPDPAKIPWRALGADVVLECTGRWRRRPDFAKHLDAGAKKVIVSAPASDPDVTLAVGINLETYDAARHHIISNASCTTNCLAAVAKVLDRAFGIVAAHMTTVHAYTNDQNLVDGPHKDLRRARAGALSMIPSSTGAARAIAAVLPRLAGRFEGISIRVPTPDVSLVDLTARLARRVSVEEVNSAFRGAAAEGDLRGILGVTDEPLVSTDFRGDPRSGIVDLASTSVVAGDLVKVLAWYDNEIAYAQRLVDLARHLARVGL
ncbi:MAG: type I glyceraldehyde-3-phosphate dehydrogenase [Myxococcota bacterium]